MSDTSAKQVQRKCYKNDTSATRELHKQHKCDTSEKFHLLNDTSKTIFLLPYIYCMESERLQADEQFHSKN